MPLQFACIRIQRDDRARVKIVAGTRISVPVWACVPRAPINEVQFRIVAAGRPYRAAAVLPALAAPRLVARFARFGNHMEAPFLVSVLCVECCDVTAYAVFTTGGAEDH